MTRREKFNYLKDEIQKIHPTEFDSKILVLEILFLSLLLPLTITDPEINQLVAGMDQTTTSEENYRVGYNRLLNGIEQVIKSTNPELDIEMTDAV